jgi:hypothetical protein
MSAPKTAVNENDEPGGSEDEIGPTGQGLVPAPAGDACGAEDGSEL